jgi:hypothetical protein
MSLHLLESWENGKSRARLPVHNLESFSWVWLWTLFSIGRHNHDLSEVEERWFTKLDTARDYDAGIVAKSVILRQMEDWIESQENPPMRKDGYRLFLAWFELCEDHRKTILKRGSLNVRDGLARSKTMVIGSELDELYMKFIDAGINYMSLTH